MEPQEKPPQPSPKPPAAPRGSGPAMRQAAIAMELPFALVGPVLVGGFFGYLLDRWLGSMPISMLVVGGLGFFAGVREVQRRMKSLGSPPDGRPR